MNLKIVSPYGTSFESSSALSVSLDTLDGYITVKDEHIPILYIVRPGVIEVIDQNNNKIELAVSKGVIEVLRDSIVNIMVDTAERAEEIDLARAEEARQRAEEFINSQNHTADIDLTKIQFQLEKESARVHVAKKYRNVGGSQTNQESISE